MASHEKFNSVTAMKILRHVERKPRSYRNPDVDLSRSDNNTIIFNKGQKWYKDRLEQVLYSKSRTDIVTLCGVVVSLPKELNHIGTEQEDKLFKIIVDFMEKRYGNGVSATVHRDEKGQPHLHYLFVPIVKNNLKTNERLLKIEEYLRKYPNTNNTHLSKALGIPRASVIRWRRKLNQTRVEDYDEKLCANDVLNPTDLKSFHKELEKYLDKNAGKGIGKLFHSGITKRNGGNKTIEELKNGDKPQTHIIDQSYEYTY